MLTAVNRCECLEAETRREEWNTQVKETNTERRAVLASQVESQEVDGLCLFAIMTHLILDGVQKRDLSPFLDVLFWNPVLQILEKYYK